MDIDHFDPTPIYQQVARVIRERIKSGELKPKDRVPSEPQMVAEYGIARDTARQAVALLRSEGWVITLPQRGTFVSQHPKTNEQGRRVADRSWPVSARGDFGGMSLPVLHLRIRVGYIRTAGQARLELIKREHRACPTHRGRIHRSSRTGPSSTLGRSRRVSIPTSIRPTPTPTRSPPRTRSRTRVIRRRGTGPGSRAPCTGLPPGCPCRGPWSGSGS
ncbi:GntR family transcriptional regulator [Nocardiopsis mwathae]|uniref:GntR family transcriptional regulator n=1 Tax=Nocardiopsis mwathae TaxID=1472723 RepID=UPI001FEC4385|nr:winged helix-turn-helix domain-containing protein [Nocardiopsis mwathae]